MQLCDKLFEALKQNDPELTRGLDLHAAIAITQEKLIAKESEPQTAYINALRKTTSSQGTVKIQLDPSEDALMLVLKCFQVGDDGEVVRNKQGRLKEINFRCLIDCGSTISCIAKRCAEEHPNNLIPYERTDKSINVTFANSEHTDSNVSYAGLSLFEKQTGERLEPPRLYELELPKGIDCLLGMDWLKQYNPVIDWTLGSVTFAANPDNKSRFTPSSLRKRNKRVCWVQKPPEGLVSWQHMQQIIENNENVFVAHVTDVNIDKRNLAQIPDEHLETTLRDANHRIALAKAERVLNVKSLTKQRMDDILKAKLEAELVPAQAEAEPTKADPRHDNGKPKLFMNQPETASDKINKALLDAQDIHVLELTPEQVAANDRNEKRKQLLEHEIDLEPDSKKPNRPYYRMSKPELEELKKQIEKYLEAGMIEPSKSPFGAACLFAPKKNGKLRFCIDYRPLNNITVKNAVQPPGVEDCLQQMAGCSVFSCIDLAQGYHQVPIAESDREKTAFNTKYGHYQWKVLPFGLCNAPATFVSALNRIFSGEAHRANAKTKEEANNSLGTNLLDKFLTVYIDDLLVYSNSEEEHAEHLKLVFERLRAYGLLIQSPKAFYAQKEVDYLGHMVSAQGISVQTDKIDTVTEWPQPQEVTHIR